MVQLVLDLALFFFFLLFLLGSVALSVEAESTTLSLVGVAESNLQARRVTKKAMVPSARK